MGAIKDVKLVGYANHLDWIAIYRIVNILHLQTFIDNKIEVANWLLDLVNSFKRKRDWIIYRISFQVPNIDQNILLLLRKARKDKEKLYLLSVLLFHYLPKQKQNYKLLRNPHDKNSLICICYRSPMTTGVNVRESHTMYRECHRDGSRHGGTWHSTNQRQQLYFVCTT